MSKKVFISQRMKDRTADDILSEREAVIKELSGTYGDIEVIESYFCNRDELDALQCLAMSIELLAGADIAVFCNGWQTTRGCRIEHQCCIDYGINRCYINLYMN